MASFRRRLRRQIVRENRIYIFPSPMGLLFLGVIVVLILTAATYSNNLIFLLAFFLFSAFVVSMLQTHYNLKGVRLRFTGAEEAFEGDPLGLLFHIEQRRPRHKRGLEIRPRGSKIKRLQRARYAILPREEFSAARVEVEAWKRGRHELPEMILETYYPLGLFRAWKIFRPEGEVVIYPKPVADAPLAPATDDQGEDEVGLRSSPEGDFGELKNYLPGESYHQIAWKHYARTGDLLTKLHWGAEHRHYVIPWPARGDLETRLRHQSAWVKQAVDENASFELETDGRVIEPGRGFDHARRCWRLLAATDGKGRAP